MFAYLQGTVAQTGAERIVLDVAGIGYELNVSAHTVSKARPGERMTLHTHMHIAQDVFALYGFHSNEERAMFRRLIGVTRVGPKLALAALSTYSAQSLAAIIVSEDEKQLSRISGMGKKGAQRVILELKESLAKEHGGLIPGISGEEPALNSMRQEAAAALMALGYDATTAQRAVSGVPDADKVENLIMTALQSMSK